jgi:hypothetical protein
MTDSHLRILRAVAKRRRGQLDDHDTTDHVDGLASAGHRRGLKQAAGRADANLAAAEERRRHPPPRRAR